MGYKKTELTNPYETIGFVDRVRQDDGKIAYASLDNVGDTLNNTNANFVLVPSAYKAGKVYLQRPNTGADGTFSRNSEATYVDENGILQTAGVDELRVDFSEDPNGVMLLEDAATNLIDYSEDFSQWNTNGEISRNVGVILSPDNEISGSKISASSLNNTAKSLRTNFNYLAETTYTYSCFAKKGEVDFLILRELAHSNGRAYFDLSNGTVGTVQSDISSADIEEFINGWYKCSITFTTGVSIPNNLIDIYVRSSDSSSGDVSWTADNIGDGIYIWGAQLELGDKATSYIPTNGTTRLREADKATNFGTVEDFNSEEGVLVVNMAALSNDNTFRSVSINSGSSNNRVFIQFRSTSNSISAGCVIGGAAIGIINSSGTDVLSFNEVVYKWKEDDFSLYINGIEIENITNGVTFPSNTLNNLDFNHGGTYEYFHGKTKYVKTYKSIAEAKEDYPYIQ